MSQTLYLEIGFVRKRYNFAIGIEKICKGKYTDANKRKKKRILIIYVSRTQFFFKFNLERFGP